MLTLFIVGCAGKETIQKSTHEQFPPPSHKASIKANAVTNYHQILDDLGLQPIFTYGRVRVTPDLITVPLTPKDIKRGSGYTGEITQRTQLLSKLGTNIARAISNATGIPQKKVKTIVYEVKCEVHIQGGKVPIEDCDRVFPFVYSQSESVFLLENLFNTSYKPVDKSDEVQYRKERIQRHINQSRGTLDTDKQTINDITVTDFCRNYLYEELNKYNLRSLEICDSISLAVKPKKYFVIKNIETKGFISHESLEKFNIEFSNSPLLSSHKSEIKISSATFTQALNVKNQSIDYQPLPINTIENKKYIIEAERKIKKWLERFLENQVVK